jgi:glycine oxidase
VKVAVIGAGVGGLSVAWSLARAGVKTHVFDGGAAGAGATWASAGMLTPWQYDRAPAFQRACAEALLLWPQFRNRLEAASGVDIGYTANGVIRFAMNDIEAQGLKNRAVRNEALGGQASVLDPIPPFLASQVRHAMYFKNEGAVDNRRLGPALAKAVRASGGHVHEGERVVRVLIAEGKVLGIETSARRFACEIVLIAAGALSGKIEGLPTDVVPKVVPRKGQIMAVDSGGRAAFAGPLCAAHGFYAVPRANGHVVVGATVEDAAFSTQIDRDAIRALKAWLNDAVIGADEWPVIEAWSGLRPGTPDDAPILGPSPVKGLHFATGQFRDGILLAPWIADWVSAGIMAAKTPERLMPFGVARFQKETAA